MELHKKLAFLILQSPNELAQLPGGDVLFFNVRNEICISYSMSGDAEVVDRFDDDKMVEYIDALEAAAEDRAKYADESVKTPLLLQVEHTVNVTSPTLTSFGAIYLAQDEATGCKVVVLQRTSTGGTILLTVVKDALETKNPDAVGELEAFANAIGEIINHIKTSQNAETV